MQTPVPDDDPLLAQVRHLIVGKFRLSNSQADQITPDSPLIGGSLGLDSLDALELGMHVEEEFGLTLGNATEARAALATLASLTSYIRHHAPSYPASGLTLWPPLSPLPSP